MWALNENILNYGKLMIYLYLFYLLDVRALNCADATSEQFVTCEIELKFKAQRNPNWNWNHRKIENKYWIMEFTDYISGKTKNSNKYKKT